MSEPSPDVTEYVLTLTCPEARGIVFAVSRFVMEHGGNISASHQFDDRLTDRFFMRVQFRVEGAEAETLRQEFAAVASQFAMAWQLHDLRTPTRTLLLVSRFGHCLNDLLFRTRPARSTSRSRRWCPTTPTSKESLRPTASPSTTCRSPRTPSRRPRPAPAPGGLPDVDLVVLARYMQVLSDGLCGKLRAARSTSTTRSCRASRAPSRITRRTRAASNSSGRPRTTSRPTSTRGRSSSRTWPRRPLPDPPR